MKHYGNWMVDALLIVAAVGLIMITSEVGNVDGTVFGKLGLTSHGATLAVKGTGLFLAVACYKVGGWLYRRGKLGNVDDVEE